VVTGSEHGHSAWDHCSVLVFIYFVSHELMNSLHHSLAVSSTVIFTVFDKTSVKGSYDVLCSLLQDGVLVDEFGLPQIPAS
jgi:hypothetical protein